MRFYGESRSENTGHVKEGKTSLDFVTFVPATDEIDTTREEASL